MNFVDKQNRIFNVLQFAEHRLDALFEIAAVTCAGQQADPYRAKDHRIFQNIRHFAVDDFFGEAFRNRGFTNAGIADIKRVVLAAAAENLNRSVDLLVAADQRIDLALLRLLIEIDAISIERFRAGFGLRMKILPRRAEFSRRACLASALSQYRAKCN
jgi:hypothetical protein